MRLLLIINGRERTFELLQGKVLSCALDGSVFQAEATEITPGLFSLLIGGKSFVARVSSAQLDGAWAGESNHYSVQIDGATYAIGIRDPRRWSRARGGVVGEGRQQIVAPMPGKIARILVAEGERVEAGNGLIVVEAMKMQNEIKCHAAGTVERILVTEGQPVTAGEALLIIE